MKSGQVRLTASTVEKTVAGLDGVVDDIRGNGVINLPETEAHLGHVIAAVELDDGSHYVDLWSLFRGTVCDSVKRKLERSTGTTTRGASVEENQRRQSVGRLTEGVVRWEMV